MNRGRDEFVSNAARKGEMSRTERHVRMECTDLIACADDDVGSAEETGDGRRMGVEEPFTRLGHTVATPVDLDKLRKRALRRI